MKWMIRLCVANMMQRKSRTFLTAFGVAIGVISVVCMFGLGIGMKHFLLKDLKSESVLEITVTGRMDGKNKNHMLTDRKLHEFSRMKEVKSVYPVYRVDSMISYGCYTAYYNSIIGIPEEELEKMKLKSGTYQRHGSKPQLYFGGKMNTMFYDDSMTVTLKDDGVKTEELLGKRVKMNLFFEEDFEESLRVGGVFVTDDGKEEIDENVYCNLDILRKYLQKYGDVASGQPVDEDGNPRYSDWIYPQAVVTVYDMDHVDSVLKKLQDMGFQTENNKKSLESTKEKLKMVQALLGGIGMVALLVAVIGIGNTMMTSMYDRILDIGILKVLGCDPDELLCMFFMESGLISAVGGVMGIICSFGTMQIINRALVHSFHLSKGIHIAILPWWLLMASLAGSVLLGVLAGYFPSRWAVRQKPICMLQKQ